MKRDRAHDDVAEPSGPDALDHEQIDSDRRRYLSHLDEQNEDDAEPDRIDAILQQHGIEQRDGHNDHTEAFDEASEYGVQHEQRGKEFKPRQLHADQKLRDLLADAGIADRVGKGVGRVNDEEDIAAYPDRCLERALEDAEIELAPESGDDHRQHAADGGGFGRRHQSRIDAADGAADQHDKGDYVEKRDEDFACRMFPVHDRADAWLHQRVYGDVSHEHRGQQQPRHDTRHEQLRHGGFGKRAVDDHSDARRNQDAKRAASR